MHKSSEINHFHGLYRSECCGVERSLPDNVKFPPCPGSGKATAGKCVGQNATWKFVRPTHMVNR